MSDAIRPVVVLGAGGHARVLVSLLKLIDRPTLGALDDDPAKQGGVIEGVKLTGTLASVDQYKLDEVELVNAIGSAGVPTRRREVYEQMVGLGYRFATLIHPAAVVAAEVMIQPGAQVMASATVQPGVTLSANCLVNTRAVVDHDTLIGPHSHVASGATICGDARIGAGCHIGAGATVIQGVTVGDGVVVGAGATVVKDVPSGQTVAGTPAKPLGG